MSVDAPAETGLENAITVSDVTKTFRIYRQRETTLK
jgi:hypothetical protein